MQPFLIIAVAHFLALLSPGPDFFLLARTSLAAGWRVASGACLGIALANGAFILLVFAGTTVLREGSGLFIALQLAGCAYLLYLGGLFLRHAGGNALQVPEAGSGRLVSTTKRQPGWWRALGMGLLSGLLNPKNALFYASLAAMLQGPYASLGWKLVYGSWMFAVVLLWDLLVVALIGNPRLLGRFARALPWLERGCGVFLIALALAVLGSLFWH